MRTILLSLLVLFTTQALALKGYYNLSRSIRALGMGGAFYGLSDDEYALFYNPAGLSLYRGSGQLLVSLNGHFSSNLPSAVKSLTSVKKADELADKLQAFQGSPIHGGLTPFFPYYLRKHFGLGVFVGDTKVDIGLLGRDLDTTVDVTGISDSGVVLGYATDFLEETLHIGVNAKAVARAGGKKTLTVLDIAKDANFDLDPKKIGGAGGAIDFDLGLTYELPDLPIGILSRASFVLNNVLGSPMTIGKTGDNPPGLPRTLSLGWHTIFPGGPLFDNVNFLVDFAEFRLGGEADPNFGAPGGSFWKHVNFGVEAPLVGGWVTPRLGFMQGYLTAGLGLNLRAIKLDVATYATELASAPGRLGSRRVALRLQVGWGSAPPPPVVYSARTKPKESSSKSSSNDTFGDKESGNQRDNGGSSSSEKAAPEAGVNNPNEKPQPVAPTPEKNQPVGSSPEGKPQPESSNRSGDSLNRKPKSYLEKTLNSEVGSLENSTSEFQELSQPSRDLEASEIPRTESGPNDRFGLDKATEEAQ